RIPVCPRTYAMNNLRFQTTALRSPKEFSARARLGAVFAVAIGFGSALALVASCGADDDGPGPRGVTISADGGTSSGAVGSSSGQVDPAAPCVEGSTRECHVTVGETNGVLTCLSGERTCVEGVWGPCVGEFSAR